MKVESTEFSFSMKLALRRDGRWRVPTGKSSESFANGRKQLRLARDVERR